MTRGLQLAWSRVRNTPGLARDVSLVLVLVILGTLASAYLFSKYDVIRPFEKRYVFSAEFDQAPAIQLASRQEVRIAGVPVGKVVDGEPTDSGTARLTMSIEPGHPVYRDARVVIRSKTPLNVMYVSLDPGTPSAGLLPDDGTIPQAQTQRVLQPYELLDELDGRARAALTDLVTQADVALTDAPKDLPVGLAATNAAANSFKPVVQALQSRRENIRHLVTSVSRISTAAGQDDQRLADLVASLEQTLSVIGSRDSELGTSLDLLPGVTGTLRTSMTKAAALSEELSPALKALDGASGQLPSALQRLTQTVRNANDLVATAGPVVKKARPVINDLRPLTSDLSATLGYLSPVISNLPQATQRIVPWLDNLGGFVYNTAGSFNLGDVNGGLGRASLVLKVQDPTGGGLG